jgi:hypothetical protein
MRPAAQAIARRLPLQMEWLNGLKTRLRRFLPVILNSAGISILKICRLIPQSKINLASPVGLNAGQDICERKDLALGTL